MSKNNKHPNSIAILGAGSWGTAVAIHLAKSGHRVHLWGREAALIKTMQTKRENTTFLPGNTLPDNIIPESDLEHCLEQVHDVCIAVPSHAFISLCERITPPQHGLFWLTKGLDPTTNRPFSEYIAKRYGEHYPCALLSGPSFAQELAKGLPTALTLASNDAPFQHHLMQLFHQPSLRVYLSHDMAGVQLCGAIKNVLAIACGMSDGLSFGANAKAAILTRGLAEMVRLGLAMHGIEQTFYGLAGLGDVILTCTDNQSRNRRFGLALGQGESIEASIKAIGQVVEGTQNAAQVVSLAKQLRVNMPICEAVLHVIQHQLTPHEAAIQLMNRAPSEQS